MVEDKIFLVHIDFAEDGQEYILYYINEYEIDKAKRIVENVHQAWWFGGRDLNETMEDAIDKALKKARIWFEKVEFDSAYVDYYT